MPTIIPVIPNSNNLTIQYRARSFFYRDRGRSRAASKEAQIVRESAYRINKSWESSISLYGAKSEAKSQIWQIANECNQTDWDGYGAIPISISAACLAEDFIRDLPDVLVLPEFAPDPDGSISLDWMASKHRFLSLSAGDRGVFAYAWINGSNRGRGVVKIGSSGIPQSLVSLIIEITNG